MPCVRTCPLRVQASCKCLQRLRLVREHLPELLHNNNTKSPNNTKNTNATTTTTTTTATATTTTTTTDNHNHNNNNAPGSSDRPCRSAPERPTRPPP